MKRSPLIFAISSLSIVMASSACFTPSAYRSARVLEKGHTDIGVSFHPSLNRMGGYDDKNQRDQASNLGDPGLSPDLNFHMGVAQDVEVGGRIQPLSGYAELDTKLRFIGDDDSKFHMAVQPALGISPLIVTMGSNVTLPLIATYEFNDMISWTGYGFAHAGYTWTMLESDNSSLINLGLGAGTGVEFHGDNFYMMPYMQVATQTTYQGDLGHPGLFNDGLTGGISIGWHGDLLHSMDKKLDKIQEDQERNHRDSSEQMRKGFGRVEDKIDALNNKVDGLGQDVEQLKKQQRAEQKAAEQKVEEQHDGVSSDTIQE